MRLIPERNDRQAINMHDAKPSSSASQKIYKQPERLQRPLSHNNYQSRNANQGFNNRQMSLRRPLGSPKCHLCKGSHILPQCDQFKKKSVQDRYKIALQNRLCCNCLKGSGHRAQDCQNKACEIQNCNRKHHPLLHRNETN